MCLLFFKYNPTKHVKFIATFIRDEAINRTRSPLGVYFPPQKILCGVDLEANGTWLGINLETGNYGFLTNFNHKPFNIITDTKYRKGNLLMNFLMEENKFLDQEQYEKNLQVFLEEGDKINGTNLLMSNVKDDKMFFAHNYKITDKKEINLKESELEILSGDKEIISIANGGINEKWEKEKLGI